MSYASVSVTGFRDLDRQLAQLERGATLAEKQAALLKGAQVIADEERRLAPRRSGNLAASITVALEAVGLPAGDVVYIGPRVGLGGPDGWYGLLVEGGTSRTPAHPFVRPAVDGKGHEAARVVVMELATIVMRMAA